MKCRVAVLLAIGLLFGRSAFGVTQLITNGDFEAASPAPWQPALGLGSVTIGTIQTNANTGNQYLTLGNFRGIASARVFQTVTIPTNAIFAPCNFFLAATSTDPADTVQFSAYVLDSNGNLLTTLSSGFNSDFSYQPASFNLTNFDGQTVEIAFQVDALDAGIGLNSSFRVDDVSLVAYTPDDIPSNDDFANATPLVASASLTVFGTNILATKEPGESKHAGANPSHSLWWKWTAPDNGVITINTTGSTFDTVLAVYTGSTVSNLTQVAANDDNSSRGDGTSQVKINAIAGTEYEIAVDGKSGASGVAQINLSFALDSKAPTVKITSPKSGSKLNDSAVTVQGTATDNLGVTLVQYRLENAAGTNDYQNADGTSSWTATVNGLIPGPNTIRVRAFDSSNNQSPEATVTVSFVVTSTLTVNILPGGSGTVTPNLDQTQQPVGNTLTLTAKPAAGQVFSSWSGDISATTPAITFVMQSNMVVNANFAPNPFTPLVGTYQGLIYDTNGPAHQSSGFFSANLTSAGSFSAKITLAGQKLSLSGQFSAGGVFSNNITRKGGGSPISVQLTLDLGGNGMTGVFSDGTFTSQLVAGLTTKSPGDIAGKYTLLIPGGTNGVAQPGGDSYGTIVVSSSGAISLKGVLSDGTKVTQKANLLTNGQWPFYAPLYAGHGSIFGWLTFSNGMIDGTVEWFKPSGSGGKLYTGGFTNTSEAAGSSYVFTSGTPVLNFASGILAVSNGNLSNSFIEGFDLSTANKITSTNTTLKMTITSSTGLFKGSVADPVSGKTVSFNGVVLQQQNSGGGFFTGTTQTGRVHIGP